jgi:hypothetical protein
MKDKNLFAVQIPLLALLSILLSSCSISPGVTSTSSAGTLPPALPSVSPTQAHTPLNPTGTPVPIRQITVVRPTQTRNSATPTPPPSSTPTVSTEAPPTPTPTRREVTPAPTQSSTPTLSAGEAKSLILDLLRDNGSCKLPCFWGLPPTASANMVRSFTDRLGNIIQDNFQVKSEQVTSEGDLSYISMVKGYSGVSVLIQYFYSSGRLEQLYTGFQSNHEPKDQTDEGRITYGDSYFRELLHYYLLPQILSNYGKPDQVLLAPILYDAPWLVDDEIDLVLLYQDEGFIVEYIFLKHVEGQDFAGYPSETGILNIVTKAPEQDLSLSDFVKYKSVGINDLTIDHYLSIEEATSMTLDEFYQTFKVPNNPCLKTPRTLWEP